MRLKSLEMFIIVLVILYILLRLKNTRNENTLEIEKRKPFNYSKIGLFLLSSVIVSNLMVSSLVATSLIVTSLKINKS